MSDIKITYCPPAYAYGYVSDQLDQFGMLEAEFEYKFNQSQQFKVAQTNKKYKYASATGKQNGKRVLDN